MGGPHGPDASTIDVAGGRMNGFVEAIYGARAHRCKQDPGARGCSLPAVSDVMGYHDAREIPNYWRYAKEYVLQDHMFASVPGWSLPTHLAVGDLRADFNFSQPPRLPLILSPRP